MEFEKTSKVEYFIDEIEELKIYEFYEHYNYEVIVEDTDFTTLSLTTDKSFYGAKAIKEYTKYKKDDNVFVEKYFSYTFNGVWIKIDWLKLDDSIGISKTFFKPLNFFEILSIEKNNRNRAILIIFTKLYEILTKEDRDLLINHYQTNIDDFINYNTNLLYDSIYDEPELIDGEENIVYNILETYIDDEESTLKTFILNYVEK